MKEGERLAQILSERGISKTHFAARIGAKFHNVHRWTKGYEFGPDNQARAARELAIASDSFESPSAEKRRERETLAVLERFERESLYAQHLSPDEWVVLRLVRFPDARLRPSVAFYESLTLALRGAIRLDEIDAVAEENAALDESLSHKPPLKRR